jgi:hypothetical protein
MRPEPALKTTKAAQVLSWSRAAVLSDRGATSNRCGTVGWCVRRSALDAFIAAQATAAGIVRPRTTQEDR